MDTMKAVAFAGKDRLVIEERPRPVPRAGEAVIRITTTTICGTDVHIVKGRVPGEAGADPWSRAGRRRSTSSATGSSPSTTSASGSSSARSRRAASASTA